MKVIGRQLSRYLLVGLLNTAVGGSVIYAMHNGAGQGIILSNVVGYGFGLCVSYIGNRHWTFEVSKPGLFAPFLFLLLVLLAFCVNLGVTFGLVGTGVRYNFAQFFGLLSYSALVFLGSKFIVFGGRKNADAG